MTDLANKKCIPCEGGIPSFNLEEIHKYLKKVDGWDVKSMDNKDYYSITTTEITRDFQKYAWPLAERSYGIDMRYNF